MGRKGVRAGKETLGEIARSYNVSRWTIPRLLRSSRRPRGARAGHQRVITPCRCPNSLIDRYHHPDRPDAVYARSGER
jgi:hypothetical protein